MSFAVIVKISEKFREAYFKAIKDAKQKGISYCPMTSHNQEKTITSI